MKGETVDVVECFSLLHECFSHFVSALQQNRAQCGGVFEQLARYTTRYQESDLHLAFILHNLLTTSAYSTSTLLF